MKNFRKKRKIENKNFEPVSECRKIRKWRPFGFFETSVCCKIFKNLKGDPLETKKISKKVAQCRKLKGRPYSLAWFCILR